MREERVKRLLSAVDELPLTPSADFVGRVRQEIVNELHATSASAPGSTTGDDKDDANLQEVTMVEIAERPSETSSGPRRRVALLGGLVAACLVFVVAIQLARSPAAEIDTNREIDVAGLDGDRDAEAAFAIVEAAFAAHEAGDGVAWVAARFAGTEFANESDRLNEIAYLDDRMRFGERIEVVGCEYLGAGDWPAFLDSGQLASGHRFRCEINITDDIMRLAGVGVDETIDWVVADGQVIGADGQLNFSNDMRSFDTEFRQWLADNRPEVILWLDSFIRLPEVIEAAEEFFAQSDDFPKPTEGP